MKLFVLGPTQSGKTCLAVGLSNSFYGKTLFRRAFVASASGDKSREHLAKLRKRMDGEEWPLGTTDTKALDFDFQWKGKKVEFSFNDYKGENSTDPAFLKKLGELGDEDGVALLVNPGFTVPCVRETDGSVRLAKDSEVASADARPAGFFLASAFEDAPVSRKWLVDEESIYAQLIENLRTRNGADKVGKPVVAVTVTASDRLGRRGDLRSRRPRFEKFLARITARLETGGFQWKRFDVSVTGVLADQSKPKLSEGFANTSARPFLWILRSLGWRRIGPMVGRIAKGMAAASVLVAFCIGGYKWYEADKARTNILLWESGCKKDLKTRDITSLKKAVENHKSLRKHTGFHAEKSRRAALSLEPDIWALQKNLVENRMRDIDESNGDFELKKAFGEVEDLFAAFAPSTSSTNLLKEAADLRNDWEGRKPGFEEDHALYVFREKVEKPYDDAGNAHGLAAMDKLYPILIELNAPYRQTGKTGMEHERLSQLLDGRVKTEWHFAIQDFGAIAPTNATHEATRTFAARLEGWNPATTNGLAAKGALMSTVSNFVPVWRTAYETTAFSNRVAVAIEGGSLESLAALFPARVATNDYLTAQFVEGQWTGRGKPAYEKACTNYVTRFVGSVRNRAGDSRPALTKDEEERIGREANAAAVPEIFDGAKALDTIRARVDADAREWDADKRAACKKWVEENIGKRPKRNRTGLDGLWNAYGAERQKHGNDKDIFNEIVRKAVYEKAERWFDEDLEFFRTERDATKRKDRFNDHFLPLCDRIKNDEENRDPQSWAYPFAVKCFDEGKIRDGFNMAFPQTFEITRIRGRIQYGGNDPWKKFKGTQIGFSAWSQSVEHVIVPCEKDDNSAIAKRDGDWKDLWSGRLSINSFLFDPAYLTMEALDRRGIGAFNTSCSWNDNESFVCNLGSFSTNVAEDEKIEFGGPFGKRDEERTMDAYVLVNIKRVSGKSIGELRDDAKREVYGTSK